MKNLLKRTSSMREIHWGEMLQIGLVVAMTLTVLDIILKIGLILGMMKK